MYGLGLRGSSPLTRGKRRSHSSPVSVAGLIPAHAGKTSDSSYSMSLPWAHPRSRGENLNAPLVKLPRTGSSPLTRGKPLRVCEARKHQGLIPAHAGKTAGHRVPSCSIAAHPRSRGENRPCDSHSAAIAGSSPLTRGKRPGWARRGRACGLIPAHAGKTRETRAGMEVSGAHPRSRGENIGCLVGAIIVMGSSPLTRGKRPSPARRTSDAGLIPAHAGKTTASVRANALVWAHPRSRGENLVLSEPSPTPVGSSPLTRGKHLRHLPRGRPDRLIPAHAGKTRA